MSKRVAAIVGVVVAFGLTAVAAVALWPGHGDRDTSGDSSPASAPAAADSSLGSTGVEEPAEGGQAGEEFELDAEGDLAAEVQGFAVEPAPSPLPVQIDIKKPPAAG